MKNNRGQTLVMFVIFLPVLIIIFAGLIEVSTINIEANKLDSINSIAIDYGLDNINDENIKDKLEELIKTNDNKIEQINIKLEDNKLNIELTKYKDSIFGKIIGKENYKIVSKYKGNIKEDKKMIVKG